VCCCAGRAPPSPSTVAEEEEGQQQQLSPPAPTSPHLVALASQQSRELCCAPVPLHVERAATASVAEGPALSSESSAGVSHAVSCSTVGTASPEPPGLLEVSLTQQLQDGMPERDGGRKDGGSESDATAAQPSPQVCHAPAPTRSAEAEAPPSARPGPSESSEVSCSFPSPCDAAPALESEPREAQQLQDALASVPRLVPVADAAGQCTPSRIPILRAHITKLIPS
jgi:hypothetical protein